MTSPFRLDELVAGTPHKASEQLRVFATIALGVVESLDSGVLTPATAVRDSFNAENCLFVEKRLKNKLASEVMGRGVQLPDLFDALPAEAARREFQAELAKLRALSLRLLKPKKRVA